MNTKIQDKISQIKAALKRRSSKPCSATAVTRGTSYGYTTITSPPKRREDGCITHEDSKEFAALFALDERYTWPDGISIEMKQYQEYIDRANGVDRADGIVCKKCGKPFWREETSEFGRIDTVRYDSVERPGYCVGCEGSI
jgi:hypothetical protein